MTATLEEALKDDVLLVHTAEGKPLPVEHGGPVRVITPQLYAWKGAKWIHHIEVLTRARELELELLRDIIASIDTLIMPWSSRVALLDEL